MATHLGDAGREFDKWLDWSGATDELSTKDTQTSPDEVPLQRRLFPVSPTSTTNSDSYATITKQNSHTAPSIIDLPTPCNSSSSPDILGGAHSRLSGDNFRDDDYKPRQNNLKRKVSTNDFLESEYATVPNKPVGSKRPHNVIEKRYRANLNEKISELRDSVPSLRSTKKVKARRDGSASSGEDDLDGSTQSNKLNKASILSKAVEYIRHLESRTKKLEEENRSLKERLQTLDKVIAEGGNDERRSTAFTSDTLIEASNKSSSDASAVSTAQSQPQGLISVPEAFKLMRQNQSQEHYGHLYASPSERSRFGGKWPTRIMLGSLAGLMVVEGFSETDQGTESREKGLFGIPLEILDGWTFLRSPRIYLATFAEFCQTGGVIPLTKGFMALTILAFFIFTYLFNSKPSSKKRVERTELDAPQPARLSSPIEVRRRAWSTSMQALRLPHHHFFPEFLALTSEWVGYTMRYLLGSEAYAWFTGRSSDDEVARIKAWDIAIDAQLAGGDTEVSRSRVLLTIFGAGTLPSTPLRLMQKAVHCRVLLSNVGVPDTMTARLAKLAATYFANRQWRSARLCHECLANRDPDRLPGYLNYLLQMDCDDVFSDIVTQRAYNLMYDRPTSEHAADIMMDFVVEDHAVRSPLDAIAAWRSTSALHEALKAALQTPDASDRLREHIQGALEIAPPGSTAETRALAVHAVLSPGRRSAFYQRAIEAMAPPATRFAGQSIGHATSPTAYDNSVPYFIDSSTPFSARPEIATCLSCAQVMLKLDQDQDVCQAIALFASIQWPEAHMTPTLLSAAPVYFALWRLLRATKTSTSSSLISSETSSSSSSSTNSPALLLPRCLFLAQDIARFLRNIVSLTTDTDPIAYTSPALAFLNFTYSGQLIRSSPRQDETNRNISSRRHSSGSNDTGYASLEEPEEEKDVDNGVPKEKTALQNVTHQMSDREVVLPFHAGAAVIAF